jgi:hypothetical protein
MRSVSLRKVLAAGLIACVALSIGVAAAAADLPDDKEAPASVQKKGAKEAGDNKTVVIRCVPSRSCDFDEDLGACVKNSRASRSVRCRAVRDVID